jgi:3'-phosphoadenosine 5'-phosphosulfate sulfotransferase (PAPS reductase)/FAD synthetase
MWSGGITSWKTARIVVDLYGRENTVLLFADTNSEDDDLHRWNRQATAELDMELTRVADPQERDVWQVFFDRRFLGNSRLAPCSHILKQEPSRRWVAENTTPDDAVLYVGLSWDEPQRIPGNRERWKPWVVHFPLAEKPHIYDKQELIAEARSLGLAEPVMYREGYQHANCAGLCVRAGQAQWALTLATHPDRFAKAEEQERRFREEINANATILRDWSNGGAPLTLTEFRERQTEPHARQMGFDDLDWGGCGCFTDTPTEEVAA